MPLTVLLFVLAVVTGFGRTSVVFPEEREAGECLPLHRCCHLARIWRERHQRQVEAEERMKAKTRVLVHCLLTFLFWQHYLSPYHSGKVGYSWLQRF